MIGSSTSHKIGFYGRTPRALRDVSDTQLDEWETEIKRLIAAPPPRYPWGRRRRARWRAARAAEFATYGNALDKIAQERFLRETAGMTDSERTRLAMERIGLIAPDKE